MVLDTPLYNQVCRHLEKEGYKFIDMGLWKKSYTVEDIAFGIIIGWEPEDKNTILVSVQDPFYCSENLPAISFTCFKNFQFFLQNLEAINDYHVNSTLGV